MKYIENGIHFISSDDVTDYVIDDDTPSFCTADDVYNPGIPYNI
jgi:hypothetical protein